MNNPKPANPNMADNFLFEHFATLATAPNGIARLRELILLFAVQGKLGTNDPKELPLKIDESKKRIRNVKSQDGDSSRTQIIDIFPPDSMPMNWRKTTLGSVGIWSTGGTPSRQVSNYFDGGIPWIKSGDLNDGIVTKTDETISQLGLDNSNAKILPKGTISIALYGATIGKLGILGIESTTNQACANCVINEKIITTRYLFYFLRSQKSYFIQVGQGGAQPNITNWIIWEWPIVIPPLTEQHRIIEKIDRLMALCDELEARQQQERAGCLRLGTASLAGLQNAENTEEFGRLWAQVCDAFDLILDCPENIDRLRDTIVVLACSGKLTEIWRSEKQDIKSASISLEKLIKDRKKKKFLKTNLKQHDFSNFPQIPDTWMWSTIEEVSERVTVGHVGPMMNEYKATGIPFLRSQNVRKNTFDEKGLVYISQEFHDALSKSKIESGDLVVVRSGNVGVCCVIPDSLKDANCSDLVIIKQSFGFLPQFGAYYVNSIAQTWVNSGKVGMALTHFNTKSVANLPIPLPPLAEQHRIVAKVDALMALCDSLEARLKERAGVQGQLAGAMVKQVAGGA